MAGIFGKDCISALKPTATWGTAGTFGANMGLLPLTMPLAQKGEVVFDLAIGQTSKANYDLIKDVADPAFTAELRWNSVLWCVIASFFGDDTKTGAGPTFTHTFNWQPDAPLAGGLTLGHQIAVTHRFENPSIKPTQLSFEPADGFWVLNTTTLGYTQLTTGNTTNTATEFANATYPTKAQRLRYKGNRFRKNAQGGAGLASPTNNLTDVYNLGITLARDFDPMDDVLRSAADGTERRRAEPIIRDHNTLTLVYSQKTADLATHINDLFSKNEYKADLFMQETIGSDVHSLLWEFTRMIPIDPEIAVERGTRIPGTHNYELAKPAAAPTGMATANEIHAVLVNTQNLTYETYS